MCRLVTESWHWSHSAAACERLLCCSHGWHGEEVLCFPPERQMRAPQWACAAIVSGESQSQQLTSMMMARAMATGSQTETTVTETAMMRASRLTTRRATSETTIARVDEA
jgi:hypothetical protein